ncbi:hypothetical protein BDP27DRAFT_1431953 [Rhodocollybia butyracea]|uniref:Uncharacterized protein n=1 Tax=Rhodocollybia butyracea TaxID=206335 RepID=A0A9P5P8W2_9AGAR|nr:hypothetical protein BDP27DRAFT_1431953 [Rhodocollybia butyracea]
MSSSFLDLPDDILFNVAKSLRVPDLLAARKRHIVDENTEFYLPFRARSSSGKMMSVLKLNALGVVTVTCDCPALRQASNGYLVIGNEFCRHQFRLHYTPTITKGLSSFCVGESPLYQEDIFLYYSDQPNGELQFNLYRLPDPAVVQAGTPVHPTHRGTLYHSRANLECIFFIKYRVEWFLWVYLDVLHL